MSIQLFIGFFIFQENNTSCEKLIQVLASCNAFQFLLYCSTLSVSSFGLCILLVKVFILFFFDFKVLFCNHRKCVLEHSPFLHANDRKKIKLKL